jgi:hypothetical protein
MSRNTVILLVALCAGVAGLIIFSRMRSAQQMAGTRIASETAANTGPANPNTPQASPFNASRTTPPAPAPAVIAASVPSNAPGMASVPRASGPPELRPAPTATVQPDNPASEIKPLPVLEKEYLATTNTDARLDLIMDIAEMPGPEAVKALTRLFEQEKDMDLKVDLLDSLLGIEGAKEEKLIMLTMGARQGLPVEVRQSAIDGLIDLDDQRVIPILNGLLNDPDAEIREGAQDAIEMIQTPPQVITK